MLDDWVQALASELGVPVPTDLDVLLDTAGTAAHAVERPAAPITTYLLGYAAASRGGSNEAFNDIVEQVTRLANGWPHRDTDPG